MCGVVSLSETFPFLPGSGPFPPDFPCPSTVSFHRNLGLPLGRFPSILMSATALMFSVSSLHLTFPNHSTNLLLLMTIAIGSSLSSSNICSFLLCSTRLTPIAHLCCCRIFYRHWSCFACIKKGRSNHRFVSGASLSLEHYCHKSLVSFI